MHYCQDCGQEHNEPAKKDKKRYHCWEAVGHNYKSEIYFYEVPGDTNGKIGQQVYTLIRSWSQLSSHGFKHIKTSCWKKTETRVIDQESRTSCALGRRKMDLNLISIVTILLTLPL